MNYFVSKDSIVRKIWGNSDNILFIFAGSSAEFALNKSVDWLYFTGKLPSDPLGRLFSTVSYSKRIIFSEYEDAISAIDKITSIHKDVESARNAQIPDSAYRDVLFMLIDYSIKAYEILERPLTIQEKNEVFDVFRRMGNRMTIKSLPDSYETWLVWREDHLNGHLMKTTFSSDLYRQYRKHLGFLRYWLLTEIQLMMVPKQVKSLLGWNRPPALYPVITLYRLIRNLRIGELLKRSLLPAKYLQDIRALDG